MGKIDSNVSLNRTWQPGQRMKQGVAPWTETSRSWTEDGKVWSCFRPLPGDADGNWNSWEGFIPQTLRTKLSYSADPRLFWIGLAFARTRPSWQTARRVRARTPSRVPWPYTPLPRWACRSSQWSGKINANPGSHPEVCWSPRNSQRASQQKKPTLPPLLPSPHSSSPGSRRLLAEGPSLLSEGEWPPRLFCERPFLLQTLSIRDSARGGREQGHTQTLLSLYIFSLNSCWREKTPKSRRRENSPYILRLLLTRKDTWTVYLNVFKNAN